MKPALASLLDSSRMSRTLHALTLRRLAFLLVLLSSSRGSRSRSFVAGFRLAASRPGSVRQPPRELPAVAPRQSRAVRSRLTCLRSTAAAAAATTSEAAAAARPSVDEVKASLLRACSRAAANSGAPSAEVSALVLELERAGEEQGAGQGSSVSGLLGGEWELVHASEDATRSSPFFWAFRAAFPDSADQIYGFTDSIPDPLKKVGPAVQWIDWDPIVGSGRFVSKVKVATLGGVATSIMTTRGVIQGAVGTDGIKVKVETTKPENSTVLQTLLGAALGSVVNENLPAFPSGEALERVRQGSSQVEMRNTFVDEEMRVSRYRENDYFVWKRRQFSSYDFL